MDQQDIQANQERVRETSAFIPRLRTEVARQVVGQEALIDRLLVALLANGHVLVEGLPGLAKTLAIKTLAQAIGCDFARLQFTPDLLPADVVGTQVYDPRDHSFSIKKGPVFANLVLADEINRAPAKVQSSLLEAMQERQVTLAGQTLPLPEPFLVMATQNPLEQEGTYPLPEAQTDRFMLKVLISYPTRKEEGQVLERMAHPDVKHHVTAVASVEDVLAARGCLDSVYLDEKIAGYILDIVFATRTGLRDQLSERQKDANLGSLDGLIHYGASPRASIALALASKAMAFLDGRAYVVPQDVKNIAPDVLRHRIIPTYEAEAEDITTTDLVTRLLDELRAP